MGGDLMR